MQGSTVNPGTPGGLREDLRDDITILEPQETPFTSSVRKTGEAKNMLIETMSHKWRTPKLGGAKEGQNAGKGNNKAAARKRFGIYMGKIQDEWGVTKEQEKIAQRGGQAGVTSELDTSESQTISEMKRDMEAINCSNMECQDGEGGAKEMKTRGAFKWLSESTVTLSPTVPPEFRPVAGDPATTASVIFVHGQSVAPLFNEKQLNAIGKNLSILYGMKKRFSCFAGANVVDTVDQISRIVHGANIANPEYYTVPSFNSGTKTISLQVDVYESSFFRLDVIPDNFLNMTDGDETGDPNAALILNMPLWYLDTLFALEVTERWKNAAGEGGAAIAEWANVCQSPRGNAKIVKTAQA